MENWKFKWELRPSIEKSNVNTTCIVVRGSLVIEQVKEPLNDVGCYTCIHDVSGHIECLSCDGNYSNYEAKTMPQTEREGK